MDSAALDDEVQSTRQRNARINAQMKILREAADEAKRKAVAAQESFEQVLRRYGATKRTLSSILSSLDELDRSAHHET